MAEVTRPPPVSSSGLHSLSSKKHTSFNNNGFASSSSSSSKHVYDDIFHSNSSSSNGEGSVPARKTSSLLCSYGDDDFAEIFGSTKSESGGHWESPYSSVPTLDLPMETTSRQQGEVDYSGLFGGFGDDDEYECLMGVPDGEVLFDHLKKKAKVSPRSQEMTEASKSQAPWQLRNGQVSTDGGLHNVPSIPVYAHPLHEVDRSQTQGTRPAVIKHETEISLDVEPAEIQGKQSGIVAADLIDDKQNQKHDICFQKTSGFQGSTPLDPHHVRAADVQDDSKEVASIEDNPGVCGPSGLGDYKQNSEQDAGSQKASALSRSNFVSTSGETIQEVGSSKLYMNDTESAAGFGAGKKQWRHSRTTSLDIGDYKRAPERDSGFHRKSRLGSSYSFDASHDQFAAHLKVQPSKVVPSSSLPQFYPVESHCTVSEKSSWKSFGKNQGRAVGGSPPSLDEHVDVNSAAAVSAAAMRRALEEAEMRIRWAKEFLKREGKGSTFKDILKAKAMEDPVHFDDAHDIEMLGFMDSFKAKVVKQKRHVIGTKESQLKKAQESLPQADSVMQTYSFPERHSALETPHVTQVSEGQKLLGEDREPAEEEKGDKPDGGGEWEAAKHLNQIISGVKSRLASFMTWQTDTEKKEEPKEEEERWNSWQQSEANVSDLQDPEVSKISVIEKNRFVTTAVDETQSVEIENGSASMNFEPDDIQSTRISSSKQRKSGDEVTLINDPTESSTESSLYFTFLGKKTALPVAKQEDMKVALEELESASEHRLQEVQNGMRLEGLHGDEEASDEEVDDICLNQDYEKICHGSDNEETNQILNESCLINEQDLTEGTQVDCKTMLSEELEKETLNNSLFPEKTVEDIENDAELNVHEGLEEPEERPTEEMIDNLNSAANVVEKNEDDVSDKCEVISEAEDFQDNVQNVEEVDAVEEMWNGAEASGEVFLQQDDESDMVLTDIVDAKGQTSWRVEQMGQNLINHMDETAEGVVEDAFATDDDHKQAEEVFFSKEVEACQSDGRNISVGEAVVVEESEEMLERPNSYLDPQIKFPVSPEQGNEKASLHTDNVENAELPPEAKKFVEESFPTSVAVESTTDDDEFDSVDGMGESFDEDETSLNCGEKVFNGEAMKSKSDDIQEPQGRPTCELAEALNNGEVGSVSDEEGEKRRVEAVHRRRRWFENGCVVGAPGCPSIIQDEGKTLDMDQDTFEECDLTGSVEVHSDKFDREVTEVATARKTDTTMNSADIEGTVEATHKRKRWFVDKGQEGMPEPPSLFEGIEVTRRTGPQIVNEILQDSIPEKYVGKVGADSRDSLNMTEDHVVADEEKGIHNVEATPRRKRWFESAEKLGATRKLINEEVGMNDMDQESKAKGENETGGENLNATVLEKDGVHKVETGKESHRDMSLVQKRKEKEKERVAVERAIREARERAFVEARERARRDAAEKPNSETHQKPVAGAQDKNGKVSNEASSSSDKAAFEAKLRSERAAVERATAEARERALQKSLSEKASQKSRDQDPKYHSSSSSKSSDSFNKGEKFNAAEDESPKRRKARLERQNRTMERAANALEEKNKRDLLAQKEQAARDLFAEALDAEVKRWSCGKEGNLRAMLSTLQYVLGPDSGWQPVSLTDLMAPAAVRKAYKKATLCVHPDKLQQRGATVQQKYVCGKVFDLLKEAWSKISPDDR